jgi:hypothetical protein
MTSLHEIARALGGKVQRDKIGSHVVAPGPGQKRGDRSLSVWINSDKITVHSHRGEDWRTYQAYVRERCGLEPWKPRGRKSTPKTVPISTRNMFFGETLKICRHKRHITTEQFGLLINDLRLCGDTQRASDYARAFGFATADLERAMHAMPKHYTAEQGFSISPMPSGRI